MLFRAHHGGSAGRAHLDSMALSATASLLLEDAATYILCRRKCLVDSYNGHDSIRALFCHGDVQECVLAGEAQGHLLGRNNNRSAHTRHVEQKRQRWKKSQSCGRSRLVICSTRSVKELVQVSSSRSMRWIQFANETLSGQSLQTRSTSTWHCSLTCSYS